MKLQYKSDLERAKQYWKAFWQHEVIDRPLICVTAPKDGVERQLPMPYLAGADGNFEQALRQFDKYAQATYFGGELVPYVDITLGPDQFSSFLGAELHTCERIGTSWVNAFVEDWNSFNPELNDNNPNWKRMQEFFAFAAEFSRGKFLLGVPDTHSNMDCLSAVRGPENLCYDIMDYPEEVLEALKKVRSFYKPIYERFYELGEMKDKGCIGWAPTYCEDKFAVLQCDFSCMLSPKQARQFVIPSLEEEAEYLDHSVYHYDGKEALGHLDDVLAIKKIDVIQWVPGDGNPRSIEWMDLLKKIQKAGKGLWIYDWTVDEIKHHFKELRPEGLVFQVQASSQSEADELIEWVRARN